MRPSHRLVWYLAKTHIGDDVNDVPDFPLLLPPSSTPSQKQLRQLALLFLSWYPQPELTVKTTPQALSKTARICLPRCFVHDSSTTTTHWPVKAAPTILMIKSPWWLIFVCNLEAWITHPFPKKARDPRDPLDPRGPSKGMLTMSLILFTSVGSRHSAAQKHHGTIIHQSTQSAAYALPHQMRFTQWIGFREIVQESLIYLVGKSLWFPVEFPLNQSTDSRNFQWNTSWANLNKDRPTGAPKKTLDIFLLFLQFPNHEKIEQHLSLWFSR